MIIRKEETSITKLCAFQANAKVPVGHVSIDSYQSNAVSKHQSDPGSADFHTLKVSAVFVRNYLLHQSLFQKMTAWAWFFCKRAMITDEKGQI